MHCDATDSAATCVKHHHIGFSESSLTRDRQFCCSTPFGSPPSMACLRPSDLQSCVVKYLQQVLNRIGDDQADYLPETFRSEELSKPPSPECLWKLNKNTIHLFDGDGGEVSLWMQIGLKQSLDLCLRGTSCLNIVTCFTLHKQSLHLLYSALFNWTCSSV